MIRRAGHKLPRPVFPDSCRPDPWVGWREGPPTCRRDIVVPVCDTMKRSLLSATALSLSATILLAASATPTFRKNAPYAAARATLLSRGWVPVKAAEPDCEPGREDVCAAYPEAQSCAGTGFGLCTFRFRSPGLKCWFSFGRGSNRAGLPEPRHFISAE